MRRTLIMVLLVLAAGCASHRIRCNGRLEPINAPAPAGQTSPGPASGSPRGGPSEADPRP